MGAAINEAHTNGVKAIAFGDLYLEDVRRYREEKLAPTGLKPMFPLWGLETPLLAREMVNSGLRAHITCVDPQQLARTFAGRTFGHQFLDDLPKGVDPCGENGEFHSFAYDGPMFDSPLPIVPGETVERDGFIFADIILGADFTGPRRPSEEDPRTGMAPSLGPAGPGFWLAIDARAMVSWPSPQGQERDSRDPVCNAVSGLGRFGGGRLLTVRTRPEGGSPAWI